MKCPKCKKEIEEVIVISECSQRGILEDDSYKIDEYEEVDIGSTIRIECSECFEDITKFVEE